MKRDLIISGALANCGGLVTTDELLDFFSSKLHNIEFYKFKPKPGSITAASMDWQAIVNTSASIIVIGQVLWAAYRKFIKPILRKNPKSDADLYIHIRTEEWISEQFMIGKHFKDEDSFIKGFKKSVKKLNQQLLNEGKMKIAKEKIRRSEGWVRIKRILSV